MSRQTAGGPSTVPLDPRGQPALELIVVTDRTVERRRVEAGRSYVVGRGTDADIRVDDPSLSRNHARVTMPDDGGEVWLEDLGSSNGTLVDGKAIDEPVPLEIDNTVEIGATLVVLKRAADRGTGELPGEGPWRSALALLDRAAATKLNVLIRGEAGTGRRRAALDLASKAGISPHVIDCSAEDPITILDESAAALVLLDIHSLNRARQRELALRLAPRRIRVVSTSLVDLRRTAVEGNFDPQLLTLIEGVTVELPALRRFEEDFDYAIDRLVADAAARMDLALPELEESARERMKRYDWPGNLAELHAVIERAIVRSPLCIRSADLRFGRSDGDNPSPEARERQRIEEALSQCAGNQTKAAKVLGVSRRTLISRLDRYGIPRPRKGRSEE